MEEEGERDTRLLIVPRKRFFIRGAKYLFIYLFVPATNRENKSCLASRIEIPLPILLQNAPPYLSIHCSFDFALLFVELERGGEEEWDKENKSEREERGRAKRREENEG